MLNPPVNGKIQGLFKAFQCVSSSFQGKSNFQGLFKTVLYIQVLFKPVRILCIQRKENLTLYKYGNSRKKTSCFNIPFTVESFGLFDLTLYVPSTIFQLNRDGCSWVEPALS